jgi:outer membrane protein TolC
MDSGIDDEAGLGERCRMLRPLSALVLASASLLARPSSAQQASLADVVKLALQRNERSGIAAETVVSADAAVTKARAGFLPTVNLNGSEVLRPYQIEDKGRTVLRSNAASGGLTVTQPVVAVTAFPLYAAAKHSYEASRFSETDSRRKLSFDTARAFFGVITAQRLLAAAQSRLDRSNASLEDTRARAQAQLVSSNDVTRAEVDRASAEQSVATATSGLVEAELNLDYIANGPVSGGLSPPAESLAPWALDPGDLIRRAIAQRPDLASLREATLAAIDSAKEPGLRFVPALTAQAAVRTADQAFANVPVFLGSRYLDATLSLNLSWAIWDAGVRAADADSRGAAANIASLQERALFRQVDVDVRTAIAEIVAAQNSLKAAEEGLEASKRNVDETDALYKQGLAKAIERVDANGSRFDADVAFAAAQLAVRQAELDLRASIGLYPIDGLK